MSSCSTCGRQITWAINQATNKRVPLDPNPIPAGNVARVGYDDKGVPIVVFLKKDETTNNPRYRSHFMTCPHAQRHRKPKAPKQPKPVPPPALFDL